MATPLPSQPDLAQLKRLAKELLRSARAGDESALRRLRHGQRQVRPPVLADAHRAIANGHGYRSWLELRSAATERSRQLVGATASAPVFRTKTASDPSLFTASAFLERAAASGWEPGPLPSSIIFAFHGMYANLLAEDARFERNDLLAPSNATMFTTVGPGPIIGVTCLSPGATAMIGQVENQVALRGADRFAILGSAGAIRSDVAVGEVIVIERAVRDDGISQHYLPAETFAEADLAFAEDVGRALNRRGVQARLGSTWTVPTPYRSTEHEVTALAALGVDVVECEIASLLAVAEALGVAATACVTVTSSLVNPSPGPGAAPTMPDPKAVLDALLVGVGMSD